MAVFEADEVIGGGMRTRELTLPGFRHDICSAIHPMAVASPFFGSLPLAEHGLEWVHPPVPLAHPLDDGSAVLLERSVTTGRLGLDLGGRVSSRARDSNFPGSMAFSASDALRR